MPFHLSLGKESTCAAWRSSQISWFLFHPCRIAQTLCITRPSLRCHFLEMLRSPHSLPTLTVGKKIHGTRVVSTVLVFFFLRQELFIAVFSACHDRGGHPVQSIQEYTTGHGARFSRAFSRGRALVLYVQYNNNATEWSNWARGTPGAWQPSVRKSPGNGRLGGVAIRQRASGRCRSCRRCCWDSRWGEQRNALV